MARAAANADVFSAIAEPRRREIIEVLAREGECPVGQLVAALEMAQPAVSKHLAVLREVGIVAVTRRGRERVYRLRAEELRPVHDWVKAYERFWDRQAMRIKARAERAARAGAARGPRAGQEAE
ncbi:MAG TPA: metalloregulator ArsR/SmtB family transcription factor [Phycisphaerales bacterium]|nr:metalloregulator ArsR/SmtB family transcription factor [Phycisphaerales bacterium]